jgi:ankyrin repeat protein
MGVLVDERGIVLARQGWFDSDSMKKATDAFLSAVPADHPKRPMGSSFRYEETQPTIDGDLELLKQQIDKSPELLTKIFPYSPRFRSGDMTLLHYAISQRHPDGEQLDIVRFLIGKGADVNKQTEHAPTPLHLAAKVGSLPITQFLINHGADINAKAQGDGPTPLQEALIHGHSDVVQLLVKSGAKSNFFTDVAMGNIEPVRAKVMADSSIAMRPDGWSRPPLTYAAAAGQAEMVKLLLAAGAHDLPMDEYRYRDEPSAIWWAVDVKNVAMVQLLCDNGSDPNLLDDAIYGDSVDVVRALLAHHADPNREDIRGYRPLHNAALLNRAEIAYVLLDAGADLDAPTGFDRSPCGPGPGFSDRETSLHLAAKEGSLKTVSELIRRGAKLNPLDTSGQTPLHSAASSYQPPAAVLGAIKALVEAKAFVNAKDAQGQTPLDCALKASRTADKPDPVVVDFLRAHGAKEGADVPGPNAVPPGNPDDANAGDAQTPKPPESPVVK